MIRKQLYVFKLRKHIVLLSMSISTPWFSLIKFSASLMMVNVFKPRKSILITPASSMILPSNWVTNKSESLEVATGIISVKSCGAMIIPAAWIPVLRTDPSRTKASFKTFARRSSPSAIALNFLVFYWLNLFSFSKKLIIFFQY